MEKILVEETEHKYPAWPNIHRYFYTSINKVAVFTKLKCPHFSQLTTFNYVHNPISLHHKFKCLPNHNQQSKERRKLQNDCAWVGGFAAWAQLCGSGRFQEQSITAQWHYSPTNQCSEGKGMDPVPAPHYTCMTCKVLNYNIWRILSHKHVFHYTLFPLGAC